MNLLVGSLTIGFILSLLALGVYISFRIFDFPDITADGSITLGAAGCAVMLVHGVNPVAATVTGAALGCLAGFTTGILHTRFNIHGLLSGILVMTALYSVNLHIMGRSNVPLLTETTLGSYAERIGMSWLGGNSNVNLWGWEFLVRDLAILIFVFLLIIVVCSLLYLFFRTNLGTAMRLGVNTKNMIVIGLVISNGLVAFSGALLAQYQGFADVQMGIGMVVWGLASVIIGEALVQTRQLGLTIAGAVMGSILFRLLVAISLRKGLNPNDLKLITAIFVFVALILPGLLRWFQARKGAVERA